MLSVVTNENKITSYSELETTINKLIGKVGVRSLINHLYDFENNFDFKSDAVYKTILGIVLQYFELSENELFGETNTTSTNGRKVLFFMLHEKTSFDKKRICQLMTIKPSTYYKHIKSIEDVIDNKNINPDLHKAMIEIQEMFINSKKPAKKWKVTIQK